METKLTSCVILFYIVTSVNVNVNAIALPGGKRMQGYESNGTVYVYNGMVTFKPGVVDPDGGSAYGSFEDGLYMYGWGVLDIKAGYSNELPDENDAIFAAGYLEGALTYRHIFNHYNNIKHFFLDNITDEHLAELKSFLNTQQAWMETMVLVAPSDPLLHSVGLILSQYKGLVDGYNAVAPADMKLDNFAFQLLNGNGDFLDLVQVIDKKNRPDFKKMTSDELKLYIQANSHCSVLIKVLGAYENIFLSHSSWFLYAAMNRIFKHYDFNIASAASKQMSFSSYPGFLESLDDFYLMGNGLVMLQTTNDIFNQSLYDLVKPESIPAWVRVRVANMMSKAASDWGAWFAPYNSGTYNNQYMVLDLNKVKINDSIEDGALWVVEQIPGLVENGDQTEKLRLGYWPSYNVPFYESIYNLSGYPDVVASKGIDFSYQLAPRAKIFRRDAAKVTDLDSMEAIMRYNDYKSDPYSEGDACDTICCRGDLSKTKQRPMGCYDTKVADYYMARRGQARVINGPTLGHDLQPFSWSQFPNNSHIGLPDVYNFPFVQMGPFW